MNGLFLALGQAASDGRKPERPATWLMVVMSIALILLMLGMAVTAYGHGVPLSKFRSNELKLKNHQWCSGGIIYEAEGIGTFAMIKYNGMDSSLSGLHVEMVPSMNCYDIPTIGEGEPIPEEYLY